MRKGPLFIIGLVVAVFGLTLFVAAFSDPAPWFGGHDGIRGVSFFAKFSRIMLTVFAMDAALLLAVVGICWVVKHASLVIKAGARTGYLMTSHTRVMADYHRGAHQSHQ